jgi:tetratricopeptide (TPR) repeat protein
MISSTVLDLPDHRKEVMDACLREGMFPLMMDHLPALDTEAIEASIEMVNKAGVYVGVFAHRYGYVPKHENPTKISITEMEYDRAVERGIPRFIFLMHKDHALKAADVETGAGSKKLDKLRAKLQTERVANFFKSPEDLRANVVNTLSRYKQKKAVEAPNTDGQLKSTPSAFHYISEIPAPPETYIAHPYTLLQTRSLVGRQTELNFLTDWVNKPKSDANLAHILSVVAIGGMGKSALTWKWFNDIAPVEMNPMAGRMWWSFYESDATFENFIIRALAYVSERSIEEVEKMNLLDRENQLIHILDMQPFLLVLDGLERLLTAYARIDAAYLSDTDYDRKTANHVVQAFGLSGNSTQPFHGEQQLRKTSSPRAGAFLRRLTMIRTARVLISTRLYPFDLQRLDASPLPRCQALFLSGLSDDDSLNLWRSFSVTGAQADLIPIFNSVGNHALLIHALASLVANYRPARGDFERWRAVNLSFNPVEFPEVHQAMVHVLEFALGGLSALGRTVLGIIAGFRMPTPYDTLAAVLIGNNKPCRDSQVLDAALSELEDRGLVGWDRRANRYDLHPIVRGVVWNEMDDLERTAVHRRLHIHFKTAPRINDWLKIDGLEDLTPAIELYHTLIGLGRHDEAWQVFRDQLHAACLYRLNVGRQIVQLLELLFRKGTAQMPLLVSYWDRASALTALAHGYHLAGEPGRAVALIRRKNAISQDLHDDLNLSVGLSNLSNSLRMLGALREAESAARSALLIGRHLYDAFREGVSLYWLGLTFATRGEPTTSGRALRRALKIQVKRRYVQGESLVCNFLAQRAIWFEECSAARTLAKRSGLGASSRRFEADFIREARIKGEAALGLGELDTADEWLHHALTRARSVNFVEEELPSLVALAELRRRQEDHITAREFLDEVWEYAEQGPYPLFHADALNVLAQIERDAGNTDEAIKAAIKAYELSWCDGPPYAYHWGLIKAQKHLEELGAPLPDLLPFDESKFEPMPEVEIDPEDEFHVGATVSEEE